MAKNILNASDLNTEVKTEVKTPDIEVITVTPDSFGESAKYKGHFVLNYTERGIDPIFGTLTVPVRKGYLVSGEKPQLGRYIGCKCELTLTESPLIKDLFVITDIKPLQKREKREDGSVVIVDIEQKGGSN